MIGHFILKNQKPVSEPGLFKWAEWFEHNRKHVLLTRRKSVAISTVFLGLGHSFGGGKPLLFETMVFGRYDDTYQMRYATYKEAVAGHHSIAKPICFMLRMHKKYL